MKSVRQEASIILGVPIGENGWDKVVADLEVLGKIDMAKMIRLNIMLCKKMEEFENENTPLQSTK